MMGVLTRCVVLLRFRSIAVGSWIFPSAAGEFDVRYLVYCSPGPWVWMRSVRIW